MLLKTQNQMPKEGSQALAERSHRCFISEGGTGKQTGPAEWPECLCSVCTPRTRNPTWVASPAMNPPRRHLPRHPLLREEQLGLSLLPGLHAEEAPIHPTPFPAQRLRLLCPAMNYA